MINWDTLQTVGLELALPIGGITNCGVRTCTAYWRNHSSFCNLIYIYKMFQRREVSLTASCVSPATTHYSKQQESCLWRNRLCRFGRKLLENRLQKPNQPLLISTMGQLSRSG